MARGGARVPARNCQDQRVRGRKRRGQGGFSPRGTAPARACHGGKVEERWGDGEVELGAGASTPMSDSHGSLAWNGRYSRWQ